MTAKNLYNSLLDLGKQKIDAEMLVKEQEEDIRYKFAEALELTDKENNVKPSLVKMAILKSAIGVEYADETDKIAEKYEMHEEYLSQLRNKVIPDESFKKLYRLLEESNGVKEDIKEIVSEALTTEEDNEELDGDDVKKVELLLKEPLAQYKLDKENELLLSLGKNEKKPKAGIDLDKLIEFAEENGIEVNLNN
jgi:hypothetical protein